MSPEDLPALVRPGGTVVIIAGGTGAPLWPWGAGERVALFVGDADDPADRSAAQAMADELFGGPGASPPSA